MEVILKEKSNSKCNKIFHLHSDQFLQTKQDLTVKLPFLVLDANLLGTKYPVLIFSYCVIVMNNHRCDLLHDLFIIYICHVQDRQLIHKLNFKSSKYMHLNYLILLRVVVYRFHAVSVSQRCRGLKIFRCLLIY